MAEQEDVMGLLELADRCERAEGPDRKLDSAIYWETCEWINLGGWWREHKTTGIRERYSYRDAPTFTASLDAAMTLVPKGMILRQYIVTRFVPHGCEVGLDWAHGGWSGNSDYSFALALCAAALRARSAAMIGSIASPAASVAAPPPPGRTEASGGNGDTR